MDGWKRKPTLVPRRSGTAPLGLGLAMRDLLFLFSGGCQWKSIIGVGIRISMCEGVFFKGRILPGGGGGYKG